MAGFLFVFHFSLKLVLQRFVPVFLEVRHEWRSASAVFGRIGRTLLALPLDIERGVFKVFCPEFGKLLKAFVIRDAESRVGCNPRKKIVADRRPALNRLNERAMLRRHVVSHFRKVRAKGVILMRHA